MKTIYLRQQEQYSPWGQRSVVVLSLIFTPIVSALLAANIWGLETNQDITISGDLTVTGKATLGADDNSENNTIIDKDRSAMFVGDVTILGQLRTPNQKVKKQTNGYTVLPSGVYIQWGVTQAKSQSTEHEFPIEFPNAAWVIVGMRNNQTDEGLQIAVKNKVEFKLQVKNDDPVKNDPIDINWIAIGY